jgi:hypothetical protein
MCWNMKKLTYLGWRFVLDVWRSTISTISFAPVKNPNRIPNPTRQSSIHPVRREEHTGTQNLGHTVEPNDSTRHSSVPRLELKVTRRLHGLVEVDIMVRVILHDEEVVLAREGKDL